MSKGTGDLNIKCEVVDRMLVSEIYIEDAIYYNPMTSQVGNEWTIPSSANPTFSTNGMRIAGSSWTDCYLEEQITKPCSIEFDITDYTQGYNAPPIMVYLYSSTKSRLFNFSYSTGGYFIFDIQGNTSNRVTYSLKKPMSFRVEVDNSELRLYIDGAFKLSKTYSMSSPLLFGVSTSSNRSTVYKNIKVKPITAV